MQIYTFISIANVPAGFYLMACGHRVQDLMLNLIVVDDPIIVNIQVIRMF
jgi:hypothetical protein